MIVYVAECIIDVESSFVLGVFATEEHARAELDKEKYWLESTVIHKMEIGVCYDMNGEESTPK